MVPFCYSDMYTLYIRFVLVIFRKDPYCPDLEMLPRVYGSQMSEFSLEIRDADAANKHYYKVAADCYFPNVRIHGMMTRHAVAGCRSGLGFMSQG